jgi:hypothetical protein
MHDTGHITPRAPHAVKCRIMWARASALQEVREGRELHPYPQVQSSVAGKVRVVAAAFSPAGIRIHVGQALGLRKVRRGVPVRIMWGRASALHKVRRGVASPNHVGQGFSPAGVRIHVGQGFSPAGSPSGRAVTPAADPE